MQENPTKTKYMLGDRVLMLSEKINSLKFGNEAIADKKLELLEKSLDQISENFEKTKSTFQQSSFEMKHLFAKIQKEISYDYQSTDRIVKDEIRRCQERYSDLSEVHFEERRIHDCKLMKFIDDKCVVLRELIDKQGRQRQMKAEQIQNSLSSDLSEIREKLYSEKKDHSEKLQNIRSDFIEEMNNLKKQFNEVCEKQSESETQFYRMLRDLIKKVKSQISEDRLKRQNMEESILSLIEKMCDKAIQTV